MPLVVTLTVLVCDNPFESLNVNEHVPTFCGVTVTVNGAEPDVGETCAIGFEPDAHVEATEIEPLYPLSVTTIVPT